MKMRRLLSLALALTLSLALASTAQAADLTYAVTGGNLYFDAGTGTITDCDTTVTAANIPAEIYGVPVTAIGQNAFNGCSSLTAVTIPSTVTSIGQNVFFNCTSLTSIVIPDSVTEIRNDMFNGCTSLSNVQLSRNLTAIPNSMFRFCTSLTSVTIPSGVTSIGDDAFQSSGLTSITIPDSVTEIGDDAFSFCADLQSVDLGSGVVYIGSRGFASCTSLTDVTLSPAMTEIGSSLFRFCTALEEITIHEGVTRIWGFVFDGCSSLRSITLPSTLRRIGTYALNGTESLTDVYYNGTVVGWGSIRDDGYNDVLTRVTIHFAEPVAGFTDVTTGDYYAEAVEWAVAQEITNGTTATTFSPDDTVTRAQAVTFLWRAMGRPEPAASASTFTDVTNPDSYYYDAVLWATEQGIINGVGQGRFDPNGTLPYDQILTLLCRASGGDASGSDWSAAAVNWAADNGLTEGLSFSAKDSCPRADVAYCLWKQLAD